MSANDQRTTTSGAVDVWNREYFDGRLSPSVIDILRGLDDADVSAHAFADRAFRLMRAARA